MRVFQAGQPELPLREEIDWKESCKTVPWRSAPFAAGAFPFTCEEATAPLIEQLGAEVPVKFR